MPSGTFLDSPQAQFVRYTGQDLFPEDRIDVVIAQEEVGKQLLPQKYSPKLDTSLQGMKNRHST